jgi:anti-anti-sigma factor
MGEAENARGGLPIPIVDIAPARGGVIVVVLLGEHDLANAEEVRGGLLGQIEQGLNLVVDVSGTDFVDLAVVGALEAAREAARERGQQFVLQWGTDLSVERVFELTGALDGFAYRSTRQEAIDAAADPRAGRY